MADAAGPWRALFFRAQFTDSCCSYGRHTRRQKPHRDSLLLNGTSYLTPQERRSRSARTRRSTSTNSSVSRSRSRFGSSAARAERKREWSTQTRNTGSNTARVAETLSSATGKKTATCADGGISTATAPTACRRVTFSSTRAGDRRGPRRDQACSRGAGLSTHTDTQTND